MSERRKGTQENRILETDFYLTSTENLGPQPPSAELKLQKNLKDRVEEVKNFGELKNILQVMRKAWRIFR